MDESTAWQRYWAAVERALEHLRQGEILYARIVEVAAGVASPTARRR